MALKDVPKEFGLDSEEDVRFAIGQYFTELGFNATELSFEDSFYIYLGHSEVEIKAGQRAGESDAKQVRGRSDILLVRDGIPLAVVEVKRDSHDLTDDDAWQAISYARLLRRMAPFAIVTNGRDTRVYETLGDSAAVSDLLLDSPLESKWHKNGQRVGGLNQDLRYFAMQKLISINPHTLELFCQRQIQLGMKDLIGGVDDNRIYIPEVYIDRGDLHQRFNLWLESKHQCFGLVGESGCGKTNFMCAKATQLQTDYFILFYRASDLHSGLLDAIRANFEWEFLQNKTVSYLVRRIDEIADSQNKEVIIFVDALDEYSGNPTTLKAELLEFVKYTEGTSIRICISCKTYDWERFIIDNAQSYNSLALATYPQSASVSGAGELKPQPSKVGYHLQDFSIDEFDHVYGKYHTAYQLPDGHLSQTIEVQCRMPLNLRLLAEAYRGSSGKLPSDLSTRTIFELFLNRKLSQVRNNLTARQVLAMLSNILVTQNKRQVLLDDVISELGLDPNIDKVIDDLIRYGLLTTQMASNGFITVSMPFEKLRSYVFVMLNRHWVDRDLVEVVEDIMMLMSSPHQLIREAIRFYLGEIDRGESELLTILAEKDLTIFLKCISGQFSREKIDASIEHLNLDEQGGTYWNRLEQYALAYSKIRLAHFPQIAARMVPYTSGPTGVWSSESGDLVQLRQTNTQYPDPILVLPNKYAAQAVQGSWAYEFRRHIGNPAGIKYLGGMHDLLTQLPQAVAWEHITKEVANILKKGLLVEDHSPILLEERIHEVLLNKPDRRVGAVPDHLFCYERIGLSAPEELYSIGLNDLHTKIHSQSLAIHEKAEQVNANSVFERRFWVEQLGHMFLLQTWITALNKYQDYLTRPVWNLPELFGAILGSLQAVRIFEPLVPRIFDSYRAMVESNFLSMAEQLELYQHLSSGSPIVVEITNGRGGAEYLEISFILLPASYSTFHGRVFWEDRYASTANSELSRDIAGEVHVRQSGGRFGRGRLTFKIEDYQFNGVEAIVYRTLFPDRQAVASQVYGLLEAELGGLLDAKLSWRDLDRASLDCSELASVLTHSM